MSIEKTSDGYDLHLYEWTGAENPKVTVALLHGYGEHAGRYAHVAKVFNERGINVVGVDLRGHGKSSGTRGHVNTFEEFHRDVNTTVARAKTLSRGGKVMLMGHSMGALLASDWLLAGHQSEVAAVLLSSPFLGLSLKVNPVKEGLGRAMSKLIPTLSLPAGLKGADVCRDPELQKLYDSDPLNNKNATARWFTETMKAIERVHARAAEIKLPILLLYGGSDKVASADATDTFAKKLTSTDKTIERLADHYHEIVNELPEVRAKVIDRMATWLLSHA